MMKKIFVIIFICFSGFATAQNGELKKKVSLWLKEIETQYHSIGKFNLVKLSQNDANKTLDVYVSTNFAMLPFREEMIEKFKDDIQKMVSAKEKYKINFYADNKNVNDFVPNFFREKIEIDKHRFSSSNKHPKPFIKNQSRQFAVKQGLTDRNIALWNSHGYYYSQKFDRWQWQRARILRTVEDKFSTQIVLNFLLPMLENAGANVFLPRERDTQKNEIIVDNDISQNNSIYRENGDKKHFLNEKIVGFAAKKEFYIEKDNPFLDGTCRILQTDHNNSAFVEYIPNIPESGYYSVSVCWQKHAKATEDAHYQVFHTGGMTEFTVNQNIAFGTWVYLGNFYFENGINPAFGKVVLTNKSEKSKSFVIADAVRFGGGMGNIARKPADISFLNNLPPDKKKTAKLLSNFQKDEYEISGKPRYLEGARYWLQWAGAPYEIYSHTLGLNDYIDDYASRGKWTKYLNDGSANAPENSGLKIPLDLSLAFHSDAGLRDTITGTLVIFSEKSENKTAFPNSQSRYVSRDMADIIQNSVVQDVRRVYDKNWTNRGIMNKSYAESRFPEVPSMILEIMSHQNYLDMSLGQSPEFQFFISRAIYKGILKFLAFQNDKQYVVQPLPVKSFSAILKGDSVQLKWRQTIDTLEVTAKPNGYLVYTRANGKGFDNGIFTTDTTLTLAVAKDTIFSYKITAVNAGGESFPSEILSVCRKNNKKETVLIINGFTRISAPENFRSDTLAGFGAWQDFGVPYKNDLAFVGEQHNFNLNSAWLDDDEPGFGASYGDFDGKTVAGNSFDYPYIHGVSICKSGHSFCSASVLSVENGDVSMNDFFIADLILGKQKTTKIGNASAKFTAFSPILQQKIVDFLQNGKAIFISGAFVGSDLWNNGETGKNFARNALKFSFRTSRAAKNGEVNTVFSPIFHQKAKFDFATQPNEIQYHVDSPDGIEPADNMAFTLLRYGENNISAAVGYLGNYHSFVCGFPFESLQTDHQRNEFMKMALKFLVFYK